VIRTLSYKFSPSCQKSCNCTHALQLRPAEQYEYALTTHVVVCGWQSLGNIALDHSLLYLSGMWICMGALVLSPPEPLPLFLQYLLLSHLEPTGGMGKTTFITARSCNVSLKYQTLKLNCGWICQGGCTPIHHACTSFSHIWELSWNMTITVTWVSPDNKHHDCATYNLRIMQRIWTAVEIWLKGRLALCNIATIWIQ
jgi:hypothetical protein